MATPKEERTLIIIKPAGVQRGLVGKIIKKFEQKGFKLVGLKFTLASEEQLQKHYAKLADKPFFPSLIEYMSSGPIVPMVWEGLNVVKICRVMIGALDPAESAPGTIRGDFCIHIGREIHGSDSLEAAKKEIGLWFKPNEVVRYNHNNELLWVYQK